MRGTAESSRVTETQEKGKKGVLRQTAESRKATQSLVMRSGTPPEPGPGKMSSTVKTLWDPKIRERGQWQSWRWVKWFWAGSPPQEQCREKPPAVRTSRALHALEMLRTKPSKLGGDCRDLSSSLVLPLEPLQNRSAGWKGEVWDSGFLRPALLSLVLSQLFFWQELWRMWWLCPSRAGTDKLFLHRKLRETQHFAIHLQWPVTWCSWTYKTWKMSLLHQAFLTQLVWQLCFFTQLLLYLKWNTRHISSGQREDQIKKDDRYLNWKATSKWEWTYFLQKLCAFIIETLPTLPNSWALTSHKLGSLLNTQQFIHFTQANFKQFMALRRIQH